MRRKLLALLALGFLLVACSTAGAPSAVSGRAGPADNAVSEQAAKSGAAGQPAPGSQPGTVPVPVAFDPTRMLILKATIAMKAKDPWAASDAAQTIAIGLGGNVMSLSQSGSGDNRVANLTLRVPSPAFNEAVKQLRVLPDTEVQTSSVEGTDVTDQFVDLEARLKAKELEEGRYKAIILQATRVEDLIRLEQALSGVRTQIEQLTGQINSLKNRAQFSTITMSITPSPIVLPVPTPPLSAYDPVRTLERALASLAAILQVFADLAIWALVFGWIPLTLLAVILVAQRARRIVPGPTA